MMYSGRLPNSSLNDAETRGTVPNPSEYTLKPVITWSREQSRSRIMDESPIVYADIVMAGIWWRISAWCSNTIWTGKALHESRVNDEASTVIAHFLRQLKLTGFLLSPCPNST